MTSQARIEANRKNARKSTGPKSEAGKERVKFNALKHGLDAQAVVLPHEDRSAYEQRLEEWTAELRPPGSLGRYLAERAVRLSWQLDRADAHETARLAHRDGKAAREKERSRRRRAAALVRRLLGHDDAEPTRLANGRAAKPRPDEPARWLARLESTAEGCQAIRAAWDEVAARLEHTPRRDENGKPVSFFDIPLFWALSEPVKMLRLLGVRSDCRAQAAAMDPRVRRIIAIQERCSSRAAEAFFRWDEARRAAAGESPPPPDLDARPRPRTEPPVNDEDDLRAELLALARVRLAEIDRLIERRVCERAEEEASDRAAAVPDAFDDSPEGERLHRYQTNWSRSLLRTLAAIEQLRHAADERPEQTQPAEAKPQPDQELEPVDEVRSRTEQENHGTPGTRGKEKAGDRTVAGDGPRLAPIAGDRVEMKAGEKTTDRTNGTGGRRRGATRGTASRNRMGGAGADDGSGRADG